MPGEWSASRKTSWGETRSGDRAASPLVQLRAGTATLVLAALVVLGLVVRLIAVARLSLQIDEPASLLGALAVAERGVPLLPSGTLYLHGATLSYLLAPLVWLGFDSMADLHTLRLVSAAIGTLAILLTYRLGLLATGRTWLALAAALLVAVDPISVQWSAHLRMYALLQVVTLAIALTFLRALGNGDRLPMLMVSLFIIAAFTHLGVALLWPAMVLVAAVAHGRTLLGANRGLGLGLLLCLLGPLLVVTLNRALAPGARSGAASVSGSVLNDQGFLTLERLLRPSLAGWTSLFRADWFAGLMPALVATLSGVVLGRYVLAGERRGSDRARVVGALLALHWIPVLLIGFLITEQHPRYAMSVYPFALILAVVALSLLGQTGWRMLRDKARGGWTLLLGATLAAAIVVANLGQGIVQLGQHPTIEPDYGDALAYVAEHRAPDEIVLSAMTPPAYLLLGGDNLAFLAGQEGTARAASYTQRNAAGNLVDYWVGVPAIATVSDLCSAFASNPGGWVVIDEMRLHYFPAFADPVGTIIREATTEVYRGGMDSLVLRIKPAGRTDAAACEPA
ncbi:MAG: hypothetical protein ACRDJC_11220 [Thermomicrobiales bacterium]